MAGSLTFSQLPSYKSVLGGLRAWETESPLRVYLPLIQPATREKSSIDPENTQKISPAAGEKIDANFQHTPKTLTFVHSLLVLARSKIQSVFLTLREDHTMSFRKSSGYHRTFSRPSSFQ